MVLDVGETLIDETRPWSWWADRLGIPRLTFFAVLGAILARGGDYSAVFQAFRPGFDVTAELRAARADPTFEPVRASDLYPDALPCIKALLAAGYRVGVAANQPSSTETVVRALGLHLDLVASSETWGVAKPDPAFFERIITELGLPADRIAYVRAIASTTTCDLRRRPGCWRSSCAVDRGAGSWAQRRGFRTRH